MADRPPCKAAGTYNGSTWSLRLVRCRADRIAAVLADLDHAHPPNQVVMDNRTHDQGCWMLRDHGDCLAAHVRRTLTEEATDAAA